MDGFHFKKEMAGIPFFLTLGSSTESGSQTSEQEQLPENSSRNSESEEDHEVDRKPEPEREPDSNPTPIFKRPVCNSFCCQRMLMF